MFHWVAALLVLLTHVSLGRRLEPRHLVAEFSQVGNLNLSRLVVDTGQIFLAGANVIYQLDDALRQVSQIIKIYENYFY